MWILRILGRAANIYTDFGAQNGNLNFSAPQAIFEKYALGFSFLKTTNLKTKKSCVLISRFNWRCVANAIGNIAPAV